MKESELEAYPKAAPKMKRFQQNMAKKNLFPYDHDAEVEFFDQNYLEPERILYTTAMFPIIFPEKSNLIKGKW